MSQLTFFEFERDRKQTLRLRRQLVYGGPRRFRGMIVVGTMISLGLILNVLKMVPPIASFLPRPAETILVICLLSAAAYWWICRYSR